MILNPFPNRPWFLRVCSKKFLKTPWEKKKLLVKSNLSFSHSVFYLLGQRPAIFINFKIVVCKLFEKSLKFVVWERVNKHSFVCHESLFIHIHFEQHSVAESLYNAIFG